MVKSTRVSVEKRNAETCSHKNTEFVESEIANLASARFAVAGDADGTLRRKRKKIWEEYAFWIKVTKAYSAGTAIVASVTVREVNEEHSVLQDRRSEGVVQNVDKQLQSVP